MTKNTGQNGKSEKVRAVVVGVDGSAGSREALRWALAEGRLRKWPVRAVHAWMFGHIGGRVEGYPYWGGSLGSYTSLGVDPRELHEATERLLERELDEVGDKAGHVEVERLVVQGAAAEVLLSAVTPGDLLVVGSRGHGGFVGLLLGSVSQQCVHHAPCPVVVVHSANSTAAGRDPAAAAETESPVTA